MGRLTCPGWLLCWLPLAAGLVSQPRLPVLAGPAAMTALARRAPLELSRMYGASKLSSDELDQLIDDVTKNKASSLIVRPYDPEGAWLWAQWSGSLLQLTRWKVLGLAALAGVNCVLVNNALQADWPLFAMPGPSFDAMIATEPLVARLESLSAVWEYELTLCTFVVTFFLNQAAMRLASCPTLATLATKPACHPPSVPPPASALSQPRRATTAPPPRRPRATVTPPPRHRCSAHTRRRGSSAPPSTTPCAPSKAAARTSACSPRSTCSASRRRRALEEEPWTATRPRARPFSRTLGGIRASRTCCFGRLEARRLRTTSSLRARRTGASTR